MSGEAAYRLPAAPHCTIDSKQDYRSKNTMSLELSGIHKVYSQAHAGETLEALRDINLTVEAGSFVSIIGPSGCGKTTLLRIICGLEQPTRGTVLLGGRKIDKPDGSIGLIFQEFALFPWRNVIDNIGFSLEVQNVPKQERRRTGIVLPQEVRSG